MRRFIFGLLLLSFLPFSNVYAWGKKGHDVIAEIGQRRLTPKAEKKVTEILGGRSMVYYSNWMDAVRNDKEYKYTSTWHYINIEKGETLESTERAKSGDVLSGIEHAVAILKEGSVKGSTKYSKEEQSDALKMLIHMVGDLHQPMHVGRKKDLGGNTIKVQYFNDSTNLHSLWDSKIVEGAHAWSYSEWADQLDRAGLVSDSRVAIITSGCYEDWLKEVVEHANHVYSKSPIGARISYDYLAEFTPVVEEVFLHGGLRLAHILNEIYK
ncbi:MAG: S1/P1 nuclease [Rikenellaceae bacterium]